MKKNKFCLIVIMIFSISISACTYRQSKDGGKELEILSDNDKVSNDDQATEKSQFIIEETESAEEDVPIEETTISNALNRWANTEVWFWGERTWGFYLLNKEMSYEYYIKTEYDGSVGHEGYYDRVAVLLTQAIPTTPRVARGPLINENYMVFDRLVEEWETPNFCFYWRWERDTLDECRDILKEKGYTKLGNSTITFGEAKEPDYGEDLEEKLEMVQDIARSFMRQIGKPEEITELYILNFHILSGYTEVLYVFDDGYWETQFQIGGTYNKPFSVSEFDDDGYYRSQFKKIAYKIDITDKENPQIISLPDGRSIEEAK